MSEQTDDTPARDQPQPTPTDLPADPPELPDDEQEDVDADENAGGATAAASGNHIEAFVRDLPEGYALCPTCLALGAVLEDPPFNPHTMTCPDCLGHTRVRTGALTGQEVEITCTRCQGHGWIPRDGVTPPASPARATDLQRDQPPRDVNGRTPDDPEFDWAQVVRDVEPITLTAVE